MIGKTLPVFTYKPRPPQAMSLEAADVKPVKVEVDSFATVQFGKVRVWIGETVIGDYSDKDMFDLLPEGRIYALEGLEDNTIVVIKETPKIIV